jgi:hypothetical protein
MFTDIDNKHILSIVLDLTAKLRQYIVIHVSQKVSNFTILSDKHAILALTLVNSDILQSGLLSSQNFEAILLDL